MTGERQLWTKLGRALLLRCPRCGARDILVTWFRLRDRCPGCTLAFDRGESEDYWLGGYAINLVVAEGVAALVAITLLVAAWPDERPALWVGLALALVLPVAFFPWSRTLWLAFDLRFRAHEVGD